MAGAAVITIVLLVIVLWPLGVGALIFAVVVGVPIFMYGNRRGKRAVEREESRWAAWEARRRRGRIDARPE
jgi:Flp pilus assembly protein TadB